MERWIRWLYVVFIAHHGSSSRPQAGTTHKLRSRSERMRTKVPVPLFSSPIIIV